MAPVPISFFSGINFKKAGGYTSFYLLSSLFDCALLSAQDAPPKNIELPEVQIILPPETVAKPKADSSQQNSASAQVAQADKAASGKVDQAKTETAVEQPKVKPGDSVQGMPGTGTTGINGYVASGTSTATKTNTPILDIPQSITIITKKEAEDRGSQTLGEVLRYVPGITVAQGEGHRDQITIRGQNTTASFFVDGVRDDVEYFRDLYNVDVIEVLKGPDAMIFGRGGGGGIVNRVTKKANGERIREATVTSGSYNRARTTVDVGDKISPDAAFRFNTMYEYSESFRDYFDLQRYGFNPTLAFRPNDNTKISLSYEYFKDDRVVDRGVPSFIGTPGRPSNGPIEDFFGNPNVSQSDFEGQSATATLEHRTESGVNIRNHTFLATYDKVYSNTFANSPVTFPGSCGDLSGCVTLGGYKNGTQRDTAVNQTDVTYLWDMGNGIRHTFLGGAEFSYQETENYRNNASFGLPGTLSFVVPFDYPTTFVPVFYDQFQRDWNTEVSTYSAYIQDQLEITKYF
ncbi:MAG: TonB-dependent receptor, partial [Hyphomicrobium sp.]